MSYYDFYMKAGLDYTPELAKLIVERKRIAKLKKENPKEFRKLFAEQIRAYEALVEGLRCK